MSYPLATSQSSPFLGAVQITDTTPPTPVIISPTTPATIEEALANSFFEIKKTRGPSPTRSPAHTPGLLSPSTSNHDLSRITPALAGIASPRSFKTTVLTPPRKPSPRLLPLSLEPKKMEALDLNSNFLEECKVKEHELSLSAQRVAELSQTEIFIPLKGENANDVYMVASGKSDVKDVVFKPGLTAACRNQVCYELGKIIGVRSVVPALEGNATVIASEDVDRVYEKCFSSLDKPLLINTENKEAVAITQTKKTGQVICKISGKDFLLEPHETFVRGPIALAETELALLKKDEFELLSTSDDVFYLAPKEQTHSVITGKNKKEYAEVNGYYYQIVSRNESSEEDEDTENEEIKLIGSTHPQNAISKQEPDENILNQNFSRLFRLDPNSPDQSDPDYFELIVPDDETFYIGTPEEENGSFEFSLGNYSLVATKIENSSYQVTKYVKPLKHKHEKLFALVHDIAQQFFIIPKADQEAIIEENAKEYVHRYGQKYEVEAAPTSFAEHAYTVIGRNIQGMVQTLVEPLFIGPMGEKGVKPLDILSEQGVNLAVFYSRIDMKSFIESFLTTILVRPQDGKIRSLEQSNVLFQAIPDPSGKVDPLTSPLRPVLIDLDETLPPNNTYSIDPDFTKKGAKTHILRCGLMAFPQARQSFSPEEKDYAIKIITDIIANQTRILSCLESFSKKMPSLCDQRHMTATKEVINQLKKFLQMHQQHNWTLEDLLFYVFPEYETQWNILEGESPEQIASLIGFYPEDKLLDYAEKRLTSP